MARKKVVKTVQLDRVSLKLEHSVKQWFTDKSATFGMPMAVYMQYILTQYVESQKNNEAVRALSALGSDGDFNETNKEIIELLQEMVKNSENEKKNDPAEQGHSLS